MKKDTINLVDVFTLFKKNLKSFYLFITFGAVIGILSVFLNINYIEKKTSITSKIFIINPLQNYAIMDLLSLDKISINKENLSIISNTEKIKNYNVITKEYMQLIISTINYSKYNLDNTKFNINTENKGTEFIITIENVSDPSKVENNLKLMVNDFNKMILPIIIKNILSESFFIENYLKLSDENSSNKKLFLLLKLRNDALENIKNINTEIFDFSITKKIQEINNVKLFVAPILIFFSFFLLFVILRR